MSHGGLKFGSLALVIGMLGVGSLIPSPLRATPKKSKLDRQEKRRQKAAQKEQESAYKHWIDDEVPYIITDNERAAFKKLTTDDEREQFIEAFWERRNPNPGSPENEFKEEYYRRIAYANDHYASGIQGWKTDRGRIYIMYGPPDEIDSHPSGGTYNRPQEEGGGETSTYPFEDWRYRYIEGIGENVILEFVDPSMSGEYHLTMDPGEKDALLHVPGAGLTVMEQMNGGNKSDRFSRTDGMTTGTALGGEPESMEEFTRLDLYSKIFRPPEVKLNDLKAVVTSRISSNLLPFHVRTDFIRVTDETVLTPITIQVANRDLQFQNKDGVMHALMDIYGEVNNLAGRVITTFDDSVSTDVPQDQFQAYVDKKSVYQKVVPLRPGLYKLSVVIKDENDSRMGSIEVGMKVPQYAEDKLENSSLILADIPILPLPTSEVGSGPFVIGGSKVRPSVNQTFNHNQTMGIYLQVYNLGIDPTSHKPSMDVRYEISKDGKTILDQAEDSSKWKNPTEQITLEKNLPLSTLTPGKYTVQINVTDNVRKQTIAPSTTFELQ